MKKILTVFLIILAFSLLASCTKKEEKIEYLGKMEFGMYPQTKVVDEATILELSKITKTSDRGFIEYNNEHYVKNTDYYKVEPISWEVVKIGSSKYLYADKIVDSKVFISDVYFSVDAYSYLNKPGVPTETPANTYQYSDLREWLNSTFLNTAFSDTEQNQMIKYEYDNFSDFVYTLSSEDFDLAIQKELMPTDYASILCEIHNSKDTRVDRNGYAMYWLRNANKTVPYKVYGMNYDGIIYEFVDCYYNHIGVRPVIKIKA